MKTILVLVLAFPFFVASGEPCPGVRSLPVEAACEEACGTRLMYDMCMDTLREDLGLGFGPDPPHSVEVTAYAVLAAQRARESFAATVDAASDLLSGSLNRDERATYDACVVDYGYTDFSMASVANDMLPGCRFGGLAEEYIDGLVHLESCRDRLMRLEASPLYTMNLVDRNKELLAYSLGQLLGI
uniref:Uncharacterized protein n=1 Tax=Avena sativa TaxID=4498 RepID=A0ACD5WTW3_AVESA